MRPFFSSVGVRSGLLQRPTVRKVIANTVWLGLDKVIGVVNGLIVGGWLARYLGPEQYGIYVYVITFVALFAPIAELGLTAIVVRNLVKEPANKDKILGTAFALQFLGGLLGFALSVGVAYLSMTESPMTFAMVAIASIRLIFSFSSLVDSWFQSQLQSKYVVWVKNGVVLVVIILKVASILLQASLMTFIWISLVEGALLAVGLLFAYQRSGQQFRNWLIIPSLGAQLLRDSWPLLISTLAVGVYVRIDKVILGGISGAEAVGIYSAAVVFVEVWYFVPTVVATSVFPVIVRTSLMQNASVYRERMQYFYDTMAAMGYLITFALIIFASPLVNTIFGPAYASAAPVLSVYALSLIFTFVGVARSKWMVTENLNRVYMWTVIASAAVNIGLNYVLIPRIGAMGAAWATVISYAFAAYVSCAFWPSLRPAFGQISLSLLIPFRFRAIQRAINVIR